jgi:hypothetical protein
MAKKTKVVLTKPAPVIYEISDLSESQKWILMADNSFRVNRLHELKFVLVMGEVIKRTPYTSVKFLDSIHGRH